MAISQIQSASLASGVPSSANMPAGTVIQTVGSFAVTSAPASTTSTSWTTTGYSINITPKFATSKIVVTFTTSCGASNNSAYFTIYKNGSNLATGTAPSALSSIRNNATSASPVMPLTLMAYDSPATTSTLTYTAYFMATSGYTAFFAVPNSDLQSMGVSIIAQEIAG